jgi:hypothetical protein
MTTTNIDATKIVSRTFHSTATRVLVVEPDFAVRSVTTDHERYYKEEGEDVARFLIGTFCNQTLACIAERLAMFQKTVRDA